MGEEPSRLNNPRPLKIFATGSNQSGYITRAFSVSGAHIKVATSHQPPPSADKGEQPTWLYTNNTFPKSPKREEIKLHSLKTAFLGFLVPGSNQSPNTSTAFSGVAQRGEIRLPTSAVHQWVPNWCTIWSGHMTPAFVQSQQWPHNGEQSRWPHNLCVLELVTLAGASKSLRLVRAQHVGEKVGAAI